jgi:hypothetical protein
MYVVIYDRNGTHIKTIFIVYGHPEFSRRNERVRVPIRVGDVAIDYQRGIGSVTAVTRSIYNGALGDELFDLSNMVSAGR